MDKCPARCMYNRQNTCQYSVIKELQEKAYEQTDVRSRAATFAHVIPIQDATRAVNRIKAFIYADRYTQYAVGKSLDELSNKDLVSLQNEERYNKWTHSKPGFYKIIERVLLLVQEQQLDLSGT